MKVGHRLFIFFFLAAHGFVLCTLAMQVAPALATGNVLVAKPSEITPITGKKKGYFVHWELSLTCLFSFFLCVAFLLSHVIDRVQFPPGVCNFIYGTGQNAGGPLVAHPDVPLVSFTGGTATGRR